MATHTKKGLLGDYFTTEVAMIPLHRFKMKPKCREATLEERGHATGAVSGARGPPGRAGTGIRS